MRNPNQINANRREPQKSREEQPVEEFSPACQVCRFWESIDGGEGYCRRHAPPCGTTTKQVVYADDEPQTLWPKTGAADWCGHFALDFLGCWGPDPSSLAGTATPATTAPAAKPEQAARTHDCPPDCALPPEGTKEPTAATDALAGR